MPYANEGNTHLFISWSPYQATTLYYLRNILVRRLRSESTAHDPSPLPPNWYQLPSPNTPPHCPPSLLIAPLSPHFPSLSISTQSEKLLAPHDRVHLVRLRCGQHTVIPTNMHCVVHAQAPTCCHCNRAEDTTERVRLHWPVPELHRDTHHTHAQEHLGRALYRWSTSSMITLFNHLEKKVKTAY